MNEQTQQNVSMYILFRKMLKCLIFVNEASMYHVVITYIPQQPYHRHIRACEVRGSTYY